MRDTFRRSKLPIKHMLTLGVTSGGLEGVLTSARAPRDTRNCGNMGGAMSKRVERAEKTGVLALRDEGLTECPAKLFQIKNLWRSCLRSGLASIMLA